MPTLTLQLPNLPPVVHILKDDTVTVGRMRGNTIVVDDDSVSLFHAKITRKDGTFLLKDLNSTNGTALNGQSIIEARLNDRDRVRFADVTGQFLLEEIAAVSSSVPAHASLKIQSPPAQPAPVQPAPAARPSTRGKRPSLMAIAAGVAALATLGFFGWKLQQTHHGQSRVEARTAPAVSNAVPIGVQLEHQSITDLARSLTAADPSERRRAATALHALGDGAREAAPGLREALKDNDQEVRIWSALTLINNKNYDHATIPILLEVLHHDNATLREVACLSLALIPSYAQPDRETVLPSLAEVADKDTDVEVRKAAMSALQIVAPEIFARSNSQ